MNFRISRLLAPAVLLLLFCALPAVADTISGCATCNGASFTLTYNPTPVASDATSQTYSMFYTINVLGFNAAPTGSSIYVKAIGVKPSSNILDPSTLASAPGGVSNWSNPLITGSLSANACTDNSGNAFACAQANSLGSFNRFVVGNSGTFTWNLFIRVGSGTFTTADSIKAEFDDANGNKVGSLLSQNITASIAPVPVPEPASVTMFGTALIGAGAFFRRRLLR